MGISLFLKRVKQRFWSESNGVLMMRCIGTNIQISSEKRCHGEIRRVSEKDLMDCAVFENANKYVPIYRKMLHENNLIYFGYLRGQCVYRHAFQLHGSIYFDGCVVRTLKENEAYFHYVYCAPEGRGNHFYSSCLGNVFALYPNKIFYGIVATDNPPALKECIRAGAYPIAHLTVKNRFFQRTLTRHELTSEECRIYYGKYYD